MLIAASAAYKLRWEGRNDPRQGAGAAREANVLKALFEDDQSAFLRKVKVVVLPGAQTQDIPSELRSAFQRFMVASIDAQGLESLLRNLTGQARLPINPLGEVPALPPTLLDQMPAPEREARGSTARTRHGWRAFWTTPAGVLTGSAVLLAGVVALLITTGSRGGGGGGGTTTSMSSAVPGCQPGGKSGGASDPEHHALGDYDGLKTATKLFAPDCALYAQAPSTDDDHPDYNSGRVAVRTSSTGALRRTIDYAQGDRGGDVKGLAWSLDGTRLAARFPGDEPDYPAEVHDVRTGSRIGSVTVVDRPHNPVLIWFTADGDHLIDEDGHSWPIVRKRPPPQRR